MKKIYQNIILTLTVMFVGLTHVYSQEIITGRIIDPETNESIEYVNVIIDGTHIGTVTDEEGYFRFDTNNTGTGFLNISFIGYETIKIKISDSNDNILLSPDASVLDEVVVVGDNTKENPAHYILKRIRRNHKKNSLQQGDTYSYKKYDKVRFDLYDPDSTLKHLGPFRQFDEFKTRKYKKGDNTYVPLLLVEEIYKVYGETAPPRKNEILEASNASGFNSNESVTMYIKELYLDYDVYDNSIVLFNKKFVSPLSQRALLTYRYAIVDSALFE
ncbi:MAG: carboxypeptidase-like regulatory domain-containing protein, partial [Flavobacteriales bacterium]|nr:carboxypeptidase-like regulatory domain-containing protein [Flavobacteriales bacterium]